MRVLVVGGGGREHALVWALEGSALVDALFCAPGNPGIAALASCVPLAADDTAGLVAWAKSNAIDLVVVGPEQPLAAGLVDALAAAGLRAFGPTAAAARLESSKAFAREFCRRHGIPGAAYAICTDAASAHRAVAARGAPVVVKADGLAAGKGVVVAATADDAHAAVDAAFAGAFGAAGATVLIEECLVGTEASLFALADGEHALLLGTAQDYKRLGDGDRGPNTGGMGAVSPAPALDPELSERVMAEIVRPTLRGMQAEGTPFRGILYCGLMLTADGPKLVEYNVRMGDPEAQVVLPRLMTDLGQLLDGAVEGVLAHMDLRWYREACVGVVMANRGYPDAPAAGSPIKGLDAVAGMADVEVFHAGTAARDGRIVASGGRVLCLSARGADVAAARARAYAAVERITWPERIFRRDIAGAG
ncbi:MAG: phosphoribosylamine--glycine ligase [Alphaproteobacteria bacterium]